MEAGGVRGDDMLLRGAVRVAMWHHAFVKAHGAVPHSETLCKLWTQGLIVIVIIIIIIIASFLLSRVGLRPLGVFPQKPRE